MVTKDIVVLCVTIYHDAGKISIYGTDGSFYGTDGPGYGFGFHYKHGDKPFISVLKTDTSNGLEDLACAPVTCFGTRYIVYNPCKLETDEGKRPNTIGLVLALITECCSNTSFESARRYLTSTFDQLSGCDYPEVMTRLMKPCYNISKDAYCRKYEQLPEYTMEELEKKLGYKFKIKTKEVDKDE